MELPHALGGGGLDEDHQGAELRRAQQLQRLRVHVQHTHLVLPDDLHHRVCLDAVEEGLQRGGERREGERERERERERAGERDDCQSYALFTAPPLTSTWVKQNKCC